MPQKGGPAAAYTRRPSIKPFITVRRFTMKSTCGVAAMQRTACRRTSSGGPETPPPPACCPACFCVERVKKKGLQSIPFLQDLVWRKWTPSRSAFITGKFMEAGPSCQSSSSCTEPVHGVGACARTMPPAAKFMEPGLCSACSSSWTEAIFGERQFME